MKDRSARIERVTFETRISCHLNLDGSGEAQVSTGIGFFDHMLTCLAKHARLDLELTCHGDLEIDDHHTAEDCSIVLGRALDQALGERRDIRRFGHAYAPLDEALARSVIDLSARPYSRIALDLRRDRLGGIATENLTHALASIAASARCTLHVDVLEGENDHHKAEAAFKSFALALRQAVARTVDEGVPSTKGVLG